ncbi:polyisoprenyl-teichoic acid--peptidoglycan teichoic acid transferase TagU [Ectobacillus funiculus]|uniref:Polyisoprenyl-teichoic acid--peptidoglycan teichoic acid transferase TagU n=1 Tax=Ectobacillus funiculus TaxID=137993 RepID=A0ABV5WBK8_9BACI
MKRKRIFIWLVVCLTVLVGGAGVYAYQVYSNVNQTLESVHQPVRREAIEVRPEPLELKQLDPVSIVLLGVDERQGDRGRSDSLMLVTVNPNENTTKLVSIPRDTYVTIEGKGRQDKVNHAYAFGGVPMTLNTLERFLGIPIDYYIEVNMQGFQEIVDAVGGVTVHNTFPFSYEGHSFAAGSIPLNGAQALAYARMRKEDPKGDFGRQERQRQVMEAVMKKGASFSSLTRYEEILQVIRQHVRTNLTAAEIYEMQKDYQQAAQSVEQIEITGEGKRIGGIWYYVVPEAVRQQLSNQLRKHLGLSIES